MARITVKAKVTGTHAASGTSMVAGQDCEIEEEFFGEEVFEKPLPDAKAKGKSRGAGSDSSENQEV